MSTYKQKPFFSEHPSLRFIVDSNDPKRKEILYKKFTDFINYSFDEMKKIQHLKNIFDKNYSDKSTNPDIYKSSLKQSILDHYISEDRKEGEDKYKHDIRKIILTLNHLLTFVTTNFNEEDIKNEIELCFKDKKEDKHLYWFFDINEILLILPYEFENLIPSGIYNKFTFDFYNVFVKYINLFIKSTISYYFEYSKGKFNDFEKNIITFFIKIHIFYLYTLCTFFKNAGQKYQDLSVIKPNTLYEYSVTHNKMINFIKLNKFVFFNGDKIKSDLLFNNNIQIELNDLDCLPLMTQQQSIETEIHPNDSDEDEEKESIRKKNNIDEKSKFVKRYRKRVAPPESAVLNAELQSLVGRTRMREELINENPGLIDNVDEPLSTADTGVFDPGMFDRKAHQINNTSPKKSPPQLPANYKFSTPPKKPDNKKKKMNPPDPTKRGGKTKSKSKRKRKTKKNKY